MAVIYHEKEDLWVLEPENTAYAVGYNREKNLLEHLYWGKKLGAVPDYLLKNPFTLVSSFDSEQNLAREEYSPWGGARYKEPCIKVKFPDFNRDLVPVYHSYRISGQGCRLEIILKDSHYQLTIALHYTVHEQYDLIERRAVISSGETGPVMLENVLSAGINFPVMQDYRLTHLAGHWAGESRVRRTILSEGKFVIESRRGHTSQYANPFFALDNGSSLE